MKEIQRYSERDHFRGVNGGEKKKKKEKREEGQGGCSYLEPQFHLKLHPS